MTLRDRLSQLFDVGLQGLSLKEGKHLVLGEGPDAIVTYLAKSEDGITASVRGAGTEWSLSSPDVEVVRHGFVRAVAETYLKKAVGDEHKVEEMKNPGKIGVPEKADADPRTVSPGVDPFEADVAIEADRMGVKVKGMEKTKAAAKKALRFKKVQRYDRKKGESVGKSELEKARDKYDHSTIDHRYRHERGVHIPLLSPRQRSKDPASNKKQSGESAVGMHVRTSSRFPSDLKEAHQDIRHELKRLPNPKLPKSELEKGKNSDLRNVIQGGKAARDEHRNSSLPVRIFNRIDAAIPGSSHQANMSNPLLRAKERKRFVQDVRSSRQLGKGQMPGGAAIAKQPAAPTPPTGPNKPKAAQQAQSAATGMNGKSAAKTPTAPKNPKPPTTPDMNPPKVQKSESFHIEPHEVRTPCPQCGTPEFKKSESGRYEFTPCGCFASESKRFVSLQKSDDGKLKLTFSKSADPEAKKIFLLMLKATALAGRRFGEED